MRSALQLAFYGTSFLVVLILSNLLDVAFFQARFHAEDKLTGRPLPALTEFLINNHHLPVHLALVPWLALIGCPLLTRTRTVSYWNPQLFFLRALAFLSCELLLFVIFFVALLGPFAPYYKVLENAGTNSIELVVGTGFWLIVALIVVLALRRVWQVRRERHASPPPT